MNTELARYVDNKTNREKLFDFYIKVYPDSPWLLNDNRFSWQNISNPLLQNNETAIWLLYDDMQNIIGQNIYIYYNLNIDDKIYKGFCSTNLIVKPGIVGKGFGHKMIEKNESFNGVAYAVGITPASTRAFLKRGWILVEDAKLMSKIINPIPNLKYLKMPSWKVLLLSPILKAINSIADLWGTIKNDSSINYKQVEIDKFSPEMDKFWHLYLQDYAIHFERSSTQLNYKYKFREDVKHSVLLFEHDGIPVGYLVFRLSINPVKKLKLGRIVDIVYDPKHGIKLLKFIINTAIKRLKEYKVDGIVGVASNKEILKAYRDNGIFFSRVQPAIIKEEGFEIEKLREQHNTLWYITLGDSDLDNYW